MSLKEVLQEWKEFQVPEYVPREVGFKWDRRISAIVGPRRAGKTYFMFQLINELLRQGKSRENVVYVDFSDPRARTNLTSFLKAVNEVFREPEYLLLDEVQELDDWAGFLRGLHNLMRFKMAVSGSSSRLTSREMATQLRGRSRDVVVFPFSFREFLRAKGAKIGESEASRGRILNLLREYLQFGGFPEIVLEDSHVERRALIRTYFTTVLYRDIVERHRVRNTDLMELLLRKCVSSAASYFSISRFHRSLPSHMRASKRTIMQYWRMAEEALFAFSVKRFSFKPGPRAQFPFKAYLVDNGYYNLEPRPSEDLGRRMENLVAVELYKRFLAGELDQVFYWRDHQGREVDFVIISNSRIRELIQVTYASDMDEIDKREISSLLKAKRELRSKKMRILSWDLEEELIKDGEIINISPLWKWLLKNA